MTDKEVMQMALDALEDVADGAEESHKTVAAIEALRTRLSQCERCGEVNPAEIHTCSPSYIDRRQWLYDPMTGEVIPLYTAPPQRQQRTYTLRKWQGLTDKEIEDCLEMSIHGTCRAIEAKLKEKNG